MIGFYAAGAMGSGGANPIWAATVTQLNFIGADGATTTTDDKGLPWTFAGNAQIDTAVNANGTSSLLLDGSGDYITTPDTPALRIEEASAATIDAVVRIDTTGRLQTICSKRISNTSYSFQIGATNRPQMVVYRSSAANVNLVATTALATGAFYAIRVRKSADDWTISINGTQENLVTQANPPISVAGALYIGREPGMSRDFQGWIGAFRMLNGLALPANYAPESLPYPTS